MVRHRILHRRSWRVAARIARRAVAFLANGLLLWSAGLRAADVDPLDASRARHDEDGPILWYDAREIGIEGRGWPLDAEIDPYCRLPARAESLVREAVWNLSRHSAGLCVRFRSDAEAIHARWILRSDSLAMPHMPATGVSGLDLYVREVKRDANGDGSAGRDAKRETPADDWRWVACGQPKARESRVTLASGLAPGLLREFLLWLPLYNGVEMLEIGVPQSARVLRGAPRAEGRELPVVFYGTSITQGGCASRPGMTHAAILARRWDRPVVNLGFSGNGRMEIELARLLGEIDAAVYVIDCLPNLVAGQVRERAAPFVRELRALRPRTPILLVEDRRYADASSIESRRQRNETSRAALWKVYRELIAAGVGGLHYLPGDRLLGEDGEDTVDGSHPTDLGFLRQAKAFEAALAPLLPAPTPESERDAIEAYTDRVSYAPGEMLGLCVSSLADTVRVEIVRAGAEEESVWSEERLAVSRLPLPANASSHGCGWPVALELEVPADWRSGYYLARLSGRVAGGAEARASAWFIVRSARPGEDTRILIELATNTYNAYSNRYGFSLYAYNGRGGVQGRRVSFDRPVHSLFGQWELPFVAWAEANGYRLDYAANGDLEAHPEMLARYRLVLSVGHDEYWSAGMRDELERFIAGGGNVAFFSGNTCCWQVRPEERGRALVCFKQSVALDPYFDKREHALLTSLWSHWLVARPENSLTGVGFLHGGYHRSHGQFLDGSGGFEVHRPEHWIFAGTGLAAGELFGGEDTIVGYECDGCELVRENGVLVPSGRDGTPREFQVLATAPARWHPDDCEWYERWEKGRTGNAVLGVYSRGGGAGTVVTTGTTDWSHGLRGGDERVMRITRNVLDRLSR